VRLLKRLLRRVLIFGLGILSVWLIAYVFRSIDHRLPTILALALTYGIAAYIILPRVNHYMTVGQVTVASLAPPSQ
jgi:hypothetical protein